MSLMAEPLAHAAQHHARELSVCLEADAPALEALEARLGRAYIQQRLGIERGIESRRLRMGTGAPVHESLFSLAGLIRAGLRLSGLLERGRRNALTIELREHVVPVAHLPKAFDGFTLLQLSDLHFDTDAQFPDVLAERIRPLSYDLCVLTGDYREEKSGPSDAALDHLRRLRNEIRGPCYAVLGNHDSIRMVPAMEAMGYGLLLNENTPIRRHGEVIFIAGIEDARFFRLEDYQRAADDIPEDAVSILLSHTPEAYRRAADVGFDLMLCGHTHGGQLCLPGGIPVVTFADSPRAFAKGSWRYRDMFGYTSKGTGTCLVDVRLNCLPEVTLHRLERANT